MTTPATTPAQAPAGIDPRGPRFAASITTVLLAIGVVLSLTGPATASADGADALLPTLTVAERAADPGFIVVAIAAALFLWGVLSPRTAPWGALFRAAVRPRLSPPVDLEDPRPPRFAQGVGLVVTVVGLALHLAGVPWALPIAAAAALIAAFLNAVFGLCLGCQLYLLLQRVGITGRTRTA